MARQIKHTYRTITGRQISLSRLNKVEKKFLALVRQRYKQRPDWTRFAAWWNAEFSGSGLDSGSVVYRICQDLEARLDPSRFVRLGRGTLANVDLITKVSIMPGGTHIAVLSNGQKLQISRLQSRALRERFLKL